MNKPIKRSKYRIMIGKIIFKVLRYYDWYFGTKKFARERWDSVLPFCIFEHRTPLIRKLSNVDMWMQHNKIKNLELAAKRINGIILRPGETFSYWRTIGKPTSRKGYKRGMVLFQGKVKPGVGGGLCQLSNLIYWITLHTGLTVTERYRHSYDVFPDSARTQPFGSGATCVYNYRDLQIRNSTNIVYQLCVFLNGDHLVGEWRAGEPLNIQYEVYEKSHSINHAYWGGYIRSNEIHRKLFDTAQNFVSDEFVTNNEAIMMYAPFIEEKTKT